ncbi:hypothetical protein ACFP1Z_32475 [Streptomyces gamaensis]|uniref:DUF4913 domain-containing protein n=1 Tax=Streptomyces gamaensis TaxID=1763542 RepID=A0ABW0Z7R9_9ACTN
MADTPFDPLDDPAALWPAPPAPGGKQGSKKKEAAEPQRWVWAAMTPPERRARLRELAVWTGWLRTTFELHNVIPRCWYMHPPVVEHLTALYAGWLRVYAGDEPAGLAEADWITTLHNLTPRLQLAACATGTHQPPPPPIPEPPSTAEDFELYLATSEPTTTPAHHPAQAELDRRLAADPPL